MADIVIHMTNDHEIFGNGEGDVNCCMIQPADRLLEITGKYSVRITFFLDVCMLWAFEELEMEGKLNRNYSDDIKNQLKEALKKGHEVQLHFHPQWLNYKYEEGHFYLDEQLWRLPKVEEKEVMPLNDLFEKGKTYLENIFQEVDNHYKCSSFRAGDWCIQPEEKVLEAMRQNSFRLDTTVVPKMIHDDGLTKYDF
ncbi:MAG: hypothetical protein ABEH43_08900, partial [Flavobacteriales bacterium]